MTHGDVETAIKVLQGDPWSADLTYGVAAVYFLRKDTDNAQKYATRFVEIAPHSVFIQRTP